MPHFVDWSLGDQRQLDCLDPGPGLEYARKICTGSVYTARDLLWMFVDIELLPLCAVRIHVIAACCPPQSRSALLVELSQLRRCERRCTIHACSMFHVLSNVLLINSCRPIFHPSLLVDRCQLSPSPESVILLPDVSASPTPAGICNTLLSSVLKILPKHLQHGRFQRPRCDYLLIRLGPVITPTEIDK